MERGARPRPQRRGRAKPGQGLRIAGLTGCLEPYLPSPEVSAPLGARVVISKCANAVSSKAGHETMDHVTLTWSTLTWILRDGIHVICHMINGHMTRPHVDRHVLVGQMLSNKVQ